MNIAMCIKYIAVPLSCLLVLAGCQGFDPKPRRVRSSRGVPKQLLER